MKIKIILAIAVFSMLSLSFCTDKEVKHPKKEQKSQPDVKKDPVKPVKAPVKIVEKKMTIDPGIWNSVDDVKKACKEHLSNAEKLRTKLIAGSKLKDIEKLELYNKMLIEVDHVLPMGELIAAVHPEKPVRTASENCEKQAKKFVSKIELDVQVYNILKTIKTDGLDKNSKRFVTHLLRDYRRAGVNKDAATRAKLLKLKEEMTKVGQEFSRNIKEDNRFLEVSKKNMRGLPKDYIKRHKKQKNGKYKITMSYPDVFPFLDYVKSEKWRKKIYKVFLSRGMPNNEKVLKKLLTLRYKYAKLLGYPNWAAYNAEDKMIKTEKNISDFINKIADLARPKMKADLKVILKRKKKDHRRAKFVGVWDRFYYVKKIKAENYSVDPKKVRSYFDFNKVKKGILDINQKLFGLKFVRVKDAKVWYKDVEAYNVLDNGKIIGRFYLDLHPRKGKYGHAAEFAMNTGIKGLQVPAASLVTNFPDPSKTDGGPALMEHGQVTTFFHEFGHLMHQLIGGNHKWVTQSGINCEWDFVEAPSQLLEEWSWDYDVLKTFATNAKGKVIPKELVEKMRKAKEFGKGISVMRQMFYAWLSFDFHAKDPSKLNLLKELKKVNKKMSPYPFLKGTRTYASFGHINGYSSMYYTYMWSLVMAKDLFTRFKKEGLLNTKVSYAYKKAVLAPGGTEDAADMVKNFLGRKYSFESYKNWLEK